MSTSYPEAQKLQELVADAKHIVIVQADNPDGDSLASSLALEEILGEQGKQIDLYCGVDIPKHLQHLEGADRVSRELPKNFNISIIVDTSSITLLEQLGNTNQLMWLKSKPCVILDHHDVETNIPFANVIINQPVVATGELIYELCEQLGWKRNSNANRMIAVAILSDSLGLASDSTSARSIHIIAELVEQGVSLADIENARRLTMRKAPDLVHYKGQLLQRIEYFSDNRVATVTIPWDEIETYSHAYNPSMLVIDDMRQTEGTMLAIAFKTYKDGKITAKIRTNYGTDIAGKLAEHFGGGGHAYASGFKIQDGRKYDDVKCEAIKFATQLLDNLDTTSD